MIDSFSNEIKVTCKEHRGLKELHTLVSLSKRAGVLITNEVRVNDKNANGILIKFEITETSMDAPLTTFDLYSNSSCTVSNRDLP